MSLSPTNIAIAAVSSLVTLCATIAVTMVTLNISHEPRLTAAQRVEIERMIKLEAGDFVDRAAKVAREQKFSDTQRAEVARIMREQVRDNPDLAKELFASLIRQRPPSGAPAPTASAGADKSELIKNNAAALFSSAHQVTMGNPQGDITLVEFFDYNCGFCKRALADMLELLKSDPKLKIVLKEFPVLGPGSLEAAKVAIAVRMQDENGAKYLEFHQKLLIGGGQANKATALAAVQAAGLDVARAEKDMETNEVTVTLDESRKLAQILGINGTPSYVVGNKLVIGAVGLAALADTIKSARN